MRSEVMRPKDRTIHLDEEINEEAEEEYRGDHIDRRKRSRCREDPWSPLSVELEEVPWPHRLIMAIVPQYERESDPREFLLQYEAAVESNGGGSAIKVKALSMAMKGPVQQWYSNLPKENIYSWSQLKSKLLISF